MKVGDIVFWQDSQFGKHRFWRIEGVFLGCEGQESLIELKSLTEKPGYMGTAGAALTTLIPEPFLRGLTIYTPDIANRAA